MCGVLAISDRGDVSHHIVRGLASLRHRGPNAWGIALHDADRCFKLHHAEDWPTDGSAAGWGLRFRGTAGIGHTRYATTFEKEELILDAQPLAANRPGVAVAFNGHLEDRALRFELEANGWSFQTKNDGEVLLNILCEELQQRIEALQSESIQIRFMDALAPAIAGLMRRLAGKGSYSVVAMFADGGLIGFRDPHGFRPLFFATDPLDGPAGVIASETAAIDAVGRYRVVRPIGGGELVYIAPSGNVQSACIQSRQAAFCALEAVYLSDVTSRLGGLEVYQLRQGLGEALARKFEHLRERVEVVLGVPDSAAPAALKVAELWRLPFGGLLSRSSVRTFLEPNQERRDSAAESKYRVVQSSIEGRRVAVVDDSIVRGTTMQTLIGKLRRAGADEVHIMVTFPPILNPCFYGIDIPNSGQLLAAGYEGSIEAICDVLRADSLSYLDGETLRRVLAPIGPTCLACTDGRYVDRSISLQSITAVATDLGRLATSGPDSIVAASLVGTGASSAPLIVLGNR